MTKATDSDDTDAVGRRDPVAVQCLKYGGATAEERTRVDELKLIGDSVQEGFTDDGVASEGANIEVADAV